MGKLLFSLMIFAVSHLALADDAPCHIPIESKAHGTKWGEITCLHCKNIDDFANFGAASMVDNLSSYTRMTVKNAVDDKQVLVTASATTRPTFLSIGWEFFSYNVRVDDHMNLEVSARTIKGRVTGKSWNSERTDKRHLRQACKTAAEDEREAAKAIAQNIRNTDSVKRIEGESIERQLDRAWLRGIRITNGGGGRTGRSWSCEAGDKGNCKDNRVPRHHR